MARIAAPDCTPAAIASSRWARLGTATRAIVRPVYLSVTGSLRRERVNLPARMNRCDSAMCAQATILCRGVYVPDSPTAIITGAGSGIGRAAAMQLASDGWRCALVGRRKDRLDETASQIRDRTSDAEALVVADDLGEPPAAD